MSIIESFLAKNGPCLTSDVSDFLVQTHGVAPATARKRVSRAIEGANPAIMKLKGVTFPRKARFIYLPQDFGSPYYWRALENALLNTKSVLGLAIIALRDRDGIIPINHFRIACGSPLKQAKHLSPDTVIERLRAANLIDTLLVSGMGECVVLAQAEGYYELNASDFQPRLVTERILLTAVADWLRKLGMASYDRVLTRDGKDLPTVGTFAWDLTAPSYLAPMLRFKKDGEGKNGFVACDVLLGKAVDAAAIRPFIHKCQTLRQLRNISPCLQIFVADRYTNEAFRMAKQAGVIPATPATLFGREVAEGLEELTQVLRRAAASIIDVDAFADLFKRFNKIEGAAIQLRGTLFEFLVADIARKSMAPTHVTMNRIFKNELGTAEADVVAVRENHRVVMIECKGYSPYAQIPDDYFTRWLQHNIPVCFKSAKSHLDWQNLPVHFEFWATGSLSAESLALYEEAKAKIKPTRYTIELKLAPDVLSQAKQTADKNLIQVIDKHYMRADSKMASTKIYSLIEDEVL
ncbi:hypothetical protein [Agrobacterium cavarae]